MTTRVIHLRANAWVLSNALKLGKDKETMKENQIKSKDHAIKRPKKKLRRQQDERRHQQGQKPDQGVPRRAGWPHEKTNRTR